MARNSVSKTRIVEPFADVASCRQNHPRFVFRYRRQGLRVCPALLLAHAALQNEHVLGGTSEFGCEILEMLRPACQ